MLRCEYANRVDIFYATCLSCIANIGNTSRPMCTLHMDILFEILLFFFFGCHSICDYKLDPIVI